MQQTVNALDVLFLKRNNKINKYCTSMIQHYELSLKKISTIVILFNFLFFSMLHTISLERVYIKTLEIGILGHKVLALDT